ncbi:MAG: hypothetical protein EOM80_19620, partial [Erysipelotrichia bacterium]|nr:hypothetical protein [Erysipelotrichia bacterium]
MDDLILELVRELYQIDPLGVTRTKYQQERLEKLLSMADQTIRSQFKLIAGGMKKELITLAEIESLFATKAINSVFTVK